MRQQDVPDIFRKGKCEGQNKRVVKVSANVQLMGE